MAYAIRVREVGGPEKMIWEDVGEPAKPKEGEVLIRNRAIGLNFLDVYYRSGLYPTALPLTPGAEAAGIVEAVGANVSSLKVGDRVGYADDVGAYAEFTLKKWTRVIKLPDGISERDAAASLLKGMTAEYLVQRTYPVKAGSHVLVHSAAGGVGTILCQWASSLGAQVIGTVGTQEKRKLALAAGCKEVLLLSDGGLPQKVKELTSGKGVDVVYDGVGKDTFMDSLDSLKSRGLMVSYGNASGAVPPFLVGTLAQKGGLFLTRPNLFVYTSTRQELEDSANSLFKKMKEGVVKVTVNQTYQLKDAAKAHTDLESRRTTGSTLLLLE